MLKAAASLTKRFVPETPVIIQSTPSKALDRFVALFEFAKEITSLLDINELLRKTVDVTVKLIGARGCLIRLLDNGEFRIMTASSGITEGLMNILSQKTGEIIPQYVSLSGCSLLIEDTSKIPDGLPGELKVFQLLNRSILCVPLKKDSSVIGTIELFDKDIEGLCFTNDDMMTSEGIATLTSLSIDRARFYEIEKAQETVIRKGRQKLETLFNSVSAAILIIDRDFKVISANDQIKRWTAIEPDEMIGRSCVSIFNSISPQAVASITFETGEINSSTIGADDLFAEISSYPINDEGKINECIIMIRDITDRIAHERKVVDLYRKVTIAKDRLKSLIDSSEDAIVTTDLNGIITSWNKSSERIFRVREEDAIGSFINLLPDNAYHPVSGYSMAIKNGSTLKDVETFRRYSDNTTVFTSINVSPIRSPDGEISGISIIARDISRRKNVENEIENIFESISDMVFITDMDYNIVKANKAVSDLVGIPKEELSGRKCYEVFHNTPSSWDKCLHSKTINNLKAFVSEVEGFYNQNNEPYLMSSSPIFDALGSMQGIVHIVRNIAELKKLRDQLAKIEKMASLGEVASGVAHSIRNPLVSIGGFAKRLSSKLQPPYNEYAAIIQAESARLEELLQKTLGFVNSRQTASETLDLNTIMMSVVHLVRLGANGGFRINEDYYHNPLMIDGDTIKLKDAFVNIITNSIQSFEKEGIVAITTAKDGDRAVVRIEDNGAGIDNERIKNIFDPFYTTKPSGTGLGLAITHKIIEEHGGEIVVESIVGTGTVFTIYFALKEV